MFLMFTFEHVFAFMLSTSRLQRHTDTRTRALNRGGNHNQLKHFETTKLWTTANIVVIVFTARRNYASAVLGVVILPVCPSAVCLTRALW